MPLTCWCDKEAIPTCTCIKTRFSFYSVSAFPTSNVKKHVQFGARVKLSFYVWVFSYFKTNPHYLWCMSFESLSFPKRRSRILQIGKHLNSLIFSFWIAVSNCYGDTCLDVLPDCHEYTVAACEAPYRLWAYHNCAAYCGFCREFQFSKHNIWKGILTNLWCSNIYMCTCISLYEIPQHW